MVSVAPPEAEAELDGSLVEEDVAQHLKVVDQCTVLSQHLKVAVPKVVAVE